MFATYTLNNRKKKEQYLGVSTLYLQLNYGKQQGKIALDEIAKVVLEKRRKLAPLLIGGIITSLSLLSIFLYSSSLEVIMLVAFGLLLTYFGLFEYVVLHIEHGNTTTLLWLPVRVKIEEIRPFIAIIEYYVSRKRFPILYASTVSPEETRLVHYESNPVESKGLIIYQFSKITSDRLHQLAVNPALLDRPISIAAQGKVIGEGTYLINQEALISEDSVSLT